MAWRSSGRSNRELIQNLIRNDILKSDICISAMNRTDRGYYIENDPYDDGPQSMGYGQTISAPHMHAYCLEALKEQIIRDNANILDVGSGSGYMLSCMRRMNDNVNKLIGIEYVSNLVENSINNIRQDDPNLLNDIEIYQGNGWYGCLIQDTSNTTTTTTTNTNTTTNNNNDNYYLFDAIHMGAASEIIPWNLIRQLKIGGRFIGPVGKQNHDQYLLQIDRLLDDDPEYNSEAIEITRLLGVSYVPLVKGDYVYK